MLTRTELSHKFLLFMEQYRSESNLTQKQMADAVGMSLSSYKRLLNVESEKIDIYSVYLLEKISGKYFMEFLDEFSAIRNIITNLLHLSVQQLRFIESVVDFESSFKDSESTSGKTITVLRPSGNMEDGMIYDTCDFYHIDVGDYLDVFPDISCGIEITSNHLHPAYNIGDILLVSKSPIRDGDTGIFLNVLTHRAYIRKFRQTTPCLLEPINGYGLAFTVDPHNCSDMNKWIKYGRVIAKMRP